MLYCNPHKTRTKVVNNACSDLTNFVKNATLKIKKTNYYIPWVFQSTKTINQHHNHMCGFLQMLNVCHISVHWGTIILSDSYHWIVFFGSRNICCVVFSVNEHSPTMSPISLAGSIINASITSAYQCDFFLYDRFIEKIN